MSWPHLLDSLQHHQMWWTMDLVYGFKGEVASVEYAHLNLPDLPIAFLICLIRPIFTDEFTFSGSPFTKKDSAALASLLQNEKN